ncbi:DNA binding protein [Streptomyces phage Triumph]|nr:DNA binding protein [Streptomyces phage Triumph]
MNIIEITNAYETAEEARTDWSIVTEEVDGIAQRAARKAAEQFSSTLEYDDAYQEALILLATRPDKAREALGMGAGALNRWLGQRLRDKHLTEAKHRSKAKSWEVNQAQLEAQGY